MQTAKGVLQMFDVHIWDVINDRPCHVNLGPPGPLWAHNAREAEAKVNVWLREHAKGDHYYFGVRPTVERVLDQDGREVRPLTEAGQ